MRKSFFTYIAVPVDSITVLNGIIHYLHYLINGYVVHPVVSPVVGYLNHTLGIEREVAERGNFNIVVRIDSQLCGKGFRGVVFSLVGEVFWHLAHIGVENSIYNLVVLIRFIAALNGNLCYCSKHSLQFTVVMSCITVNEA